MVIRDFITWVRLVWHSRFGNVIGLLRVGIIGCGKIYGTHAEALGQIDGARLEAVYDIDRAIACEAGARYGVPAAASLAEMWPLVDAVSICVPSGLHGKVGVLAAQAGKHVLVEKPVETNLQKATDLIRACQSAGVKLATVSQHRFSRAIQQTRHAVQSGALGRPLQGDAVVKWYRTQAYYESGDWRGTWEMDGGGCLMNQGVHYVDMIQWVMGGVKTVRALTRTMNHRIEVEDVALLTVEYRNGAVGTIQASTNCYPGMEERLEVHGEFGSIILEGDRPRLWRVDAEAASQGLYGGGVMMQPTPNLAAHADNSTEDDPTARWGEQHRLEIEAFVRWVVGEEKSEALMDFEECLEPLKIILAAYESNRLGGKPIEIA